MEVRIVPPIRSTTRLQLGRLRSGNGQVVKGDVDGALVVVLDTRDDAIPPTV
jgi:hypothetical protein